MLEVVKIILKLFEELKELRKENDKLKEEMHSKEILLSIVLPVNYRKQNQQCQECYLKDIVRLANIKREEEKIEFAEKMLDELLYDKKMDRKEIHERNANK